MPCVAIFHTVEQWQNDQGNIIECFLDCHDECDDSAPSIEQHQTILKEAKKRKAFVIVEDMSSYDGGIAPVASYVNSSFKKRSIPLYHVVSDCKKSGINCYNLEFRHVSAAAFTAKIMAVTGQMIMDSIDCVANEITSYNDTPMLNRYYAQVVSRMYADYHNVLEQLRQYKGAAYDFFKTLSNADKEGLDYKFDFELINARILHQIYTHRNSKHIFVCAGGGHIRAIRSMLSSMGYTKSACVSNNLRYVQKDPPVLNADVAVDLADYFAHPENFAVTSTLKKVGYVVGAAATAFGVYKLAQWARGKNKKPAAPDQEQEAKKSSQEEREEYERFLISTSV